MNAMNDNIVQRCYLQYLLSKYVPIKNNKSQAQEFETRYNAISCKNDTSHE